MPSIAGQSILILGGSSGIGFAVAKLCLAEKARVVVASSSQTKVDGAIKRLREAFPQAEPTGYTIDLGSEAVEGKLESLLAEITKSKAEPLDHIINTAGKPDVRPIQDLDLGYLATSAQMPLFVPLLVAKLGAKYLREGYQSSLILTSGQVAEKPIPGYTVFAAYATALHGMTRNLACDYAPRRVNCVSPGATETELWGDYAEMLRKASAEKSLLGKAGAPDEVAEAYLYLMKNTDATGSIVSSNAGSILK
ncbi:short chain dehydrogenase/ reductase [Apiospora saccharicola]|uniref:Short chain dehydrogenase/ reductase n=1 Tax=Apiospora saccharicola TaxID=335842 RepID=A0ABR1UN65_9PEZI